MENVRATNLWKASADAFRSFRAVAAAGMLLALHIVLALFVSLPLTETIKISISFITNVVTGYLFGPWMALATGALGDVLQFVLKPTGGYFFGWTFNAAIGGLLYGIAFYQKAPRNMEEKKSIGNRTDWIPAGILLLVVGGWILMPFLEIISKSTAEQPQTRILAQGTALQYALGNAGEAGGSARAIAIAALALAVAGIVFLLCHKRVIAMLFSIAAGLWLLLPVYTERKVMKPGAGFGLMAIGFFLCAAWLLYLVLRQHAVDGAFLLRCFITMAVVAVVVQMFLGTIWCCVMYGKGFWFYFAPRAVKSLIQLPFNTALVYYCLRAMKQFHFSRLLGLGKQGK